MYPVVHGIVQSESVTLLECQCIGTGRSYPGSTTESYRATWAIFGHLPLSIESAGQVSSISLEIGGLSDWASDIAGGKVQVTGRGRERQYTYRYVQPNPVRGVTHYGEVAIDAFASLPLMAGREITVSESVRMTVDRSARGPKSLEWWLSEVIAPMQDFISLAVDQPCNVVECTATFHGASITIGSGSEFELPFRVLSASRAGVSYVSPARSISPSSFLFSLADIVDRLGEVFDTWLQFAAQYRRVRGLYFGDQFRKLYVENRFLFMVQAAEALHQSSPHYSNEVVPKAEWDVRRKSILKALGREDRDLVARNIAHANEPSLRRRLCEMAEDFREVLFEVIGVSDDWAREVVKLRNDLTHPHKQKQVDKNAELLHQRLVVSLLLRAYFLRELGIPPDRVTKSDDFKSAIWLNDHSA